MNWNAPSPDNLPPRAEAPFVDWSVEVLIAYIDHRLGNVKRIGVGCVRYREMIDGHGRVGTRVGDPHLSDMHEKTIVGWAEMPAFPENLL
jgi:hypothetical protein